MNRDYGREQWLQPNTSRGTSVPDRQTTANNWRKAILGKMEEGLTNTASYKSLVKRARGFDGTVQGRSQVQDRIEMNCRHNSCSRRDVKPYKIVRPLFSD